MTSYCWNCAGRGWTGNVWNACPVCDGEKVYHHEPGRGYFDELLRQEQEQPELTLEPKQEQRQE